MAALGDATHLDPEGMATAASVVAVGVPFELQMATGKGVFVLERAGGQIWIRAAAGRAVSDDLTETGLQIIEETARQCGCDEVGFQTARRGLVRKGEHLGYEVVGWIMRKKVR